MLEIYSGKHIAQRRQTGWLLEWMSIEKRAKRFYSFCFILLNEAPKK